MGNIGDSGDSAGFDKSWLLDTPTRRSGSWKLDVVGVWLRFDSIDIAEPGRGLGLGLGGMLESASDDDRLMSTSRSGMSSSCETTDADAEPDRERSDVPKVSSASAVVAVDWLALMPESGRYDTAPSTPTTATDVSKRSSFSADDGPPVLGVREGRRGFRPLSSTFLRALWPTQSTSCLSASRSDTARRGAVRRTVLARGSVPYGVSAFGRIGVANG